MDIYDRIEKDHDTVRGLMTRMFDLKATEKAKRRALFDELQRELWAHQKVEEAVFYAALAKAREAKDEAAEGLNEHHVISGLLDELNGMPDDGTAWEAKFKVMTELLQHHLDEEEDELFDEAREALPDSRAEELAALFEERKQHALEALKPIAP
ncbi:hemerythrin superfamily protein [Azospirillum fermentarium]|uniref:hemerythrin domain-containing protein n=1 Tax=Azospirillum fermentarium TaxID=1233114 RepID=UPI002226D99F|nr:hemerythrin domain-containing protein [Azospirillum fermentarium]MCW2247981.1 hemerythrin superfamily protein [Azospirillum fermentarium]